MYITNYNNKQALTLKEITKIKIAAKEWHKLYNLYKYKD